MSILHPCIPHIALSSPHNAQATCTALSTDEHGIPRVRARCAGGGWAPTVIAELLAVPEHVAAEDDALSVCWNSAGLGNPNLEVRHGELRQRISMRCQACATGVQQRKGQGQACFGANEGIGQPNSRPPAPTESTPPAAWS